MLTAGLFVVPDGKLGYYEVLVRKLENVNLLSWWWIIGFVTVATVGVVLGFVVRGKRWLFVFVPIVAVATVFAVAAGVNMRYEYAKTVGILAGVPPYDEGPARIIDDPSGIVSPRGTVVTVTIPGTKSGVGDYAAKVYLPPQYFTDRNQTFPVVYVFHGIPGGQVPGLADDAGPEGLFTAADVDGAALAAAKQKHPVILVAPVVSPLSGDTECVDGTQGKWQTYVAEDVTSWVEQHQRFRTGADSAAAAGYSMGGYCAQITALRHPDEYSVLGNLSGTSKQTYPDGDAGLFGARADAALVASYDSTSIVQNVPSSRSVRVWLEVGEQDDAELVASQKDFARVAQGEGMVVKSKTVSGSHSFEVWRPGFAEFIPWAAEQLYGGGRG